MKYFLEEIGKGWISQKWYLKMLSKKPRIDYNKYLVKNPTGIISVIYTDEDEMLTTDPNDALMFDNKIAASDVHTFMRSCMWYSTPTLEITEHEFVN
jgi:hypothetical protein